MKKLDSHELEKIQGGTALTAPIINALVNVIKVLKDAGYSLGSGLRRIGEGNICPLQ